MDAPLIETRNLCKYFTTEVSETRALDGVSFRVAKGEFIALMGPSGSGKSTLMHVLGFLDQLSSGQYLFAGRDVSALPDDELARMRRQEVGFVFQAFNLLPKTTVIDNVMLPMIYSGVSFNERRERALKALDAVKLSHRVGYQANVISGGEKQRVAIARALVNEPSVIFADEPTGNLDSKTGTEVLNLLQQLNSQGRTIVMVTHELEAAEFADRIVRMKDGKIAQDGINHVKRQGEYHK